MSYGIWLSWNNQEEGFQIPVNPASIEIGDGSSGKTYDIAGLGEVNVIKNPKLTDYSFSSFFTSTKYPFVDPSIIALLDPIEYVGYIKRWMESRRPIRFVFTGDSFDINTAASIEQFDWKEVSGGSGDIEYTLKLKKYIFYAAQKVSAITDSDGTQQIQKEAPERQNDRHIPRTYTIAPGDDLWSIAKNILGDETRWYEIQALNAIPNSELKKLSIGKVIRLPLEVTSV